jgi:hypothetical protein
MAPKPYWYVKVAVRDKITGLFAADDYIYGKDASEQIPT